MYRTLINIFITSQWSSILTKIMRYKVYFYYKMNIMLMLLHFSTPLSKNTAVYLNFIEIITITC